jgi:hypothetical protein
MGNSLTKVRLGIILSMLLFSCKKSDLLFTAKFMQSENLINQSWKSQWLKIDANSKVIFTVQFSGSFNETLYLPVSMKIMNSDQQSIIDTIELARLTQYSDWNQIVDHKERKCYVDYTGNLIDTIKIQESGNYQITLTYLPQKNVNFKRIIINGYQVD